MILQYVIMYAQVNVKPKVGLFNKVTNQVVTNEYFNNSIEKFTCQRF